MAHNIHITCVALIASAEVQHGASTGPAHLPRPALFLGYTLLHSDMRDDFLAPSRPSVEEVEDEFPRVIAIRTAATCLAFLLGGLPWLLARRKRSEGPARIS